VRTARLSDDLLAGIAERVSNWGRWGADDQLGTVNHITGECRARAASLVTAGRTVSLSHPLLLGTSGPPNSVHTVWRSSGPVPAAAEFIGMDFHGPEITHLDAICHIHRDGLMYNGFSALNVVPRSGAAALGTETIASQLVGRGVLLDVAEATGVAYLATGAEVTADDLRRAERLGRVDVGTGDLVFVRMGGSASDAADAARLPGLAPECLEWFRTRDVAVVGTDVAADATPQDPGPWAFPIHQLAIFHMGMPLLDNCSLGELGQACAETGRYQFLVTIAPIQIVGGTGAPVNPLAVL
jgi:kynurenine formamidase